MPRVDDTYIVEILRLEGLLRAYLHRFAPKPNDLEDLLQETYAHLLAVPLESRGAIKSVQAFALAAARNIAVDLTRRRRIAPIDLVEDLDVLPVLDGETGLEDIVNAHQELAQLAQAVATLPDRCAEVFTLRKVYGLTQQEIAEHFGISVSTVEQHLVKAVRRCVTHIVGNGGRAAEQPTGLLRLLRWKGRRDGH
jgi:RNA polymerase sigma-70 factor (ECF subfamily)